VERRPILDPQEELRAEDPVARICRLVGKVKLGGEDRLRRRLVFHMEVARSARVKARHDCFEAILASEDVPTEAISLVVVFAFVIRVAGVRTLSPAN
jgi:hypothetical protein